MSGKPGRSGGKRPGAGRPRESAQFSTRYPLEVIEALDEIAERHGVTRSDVVRRAVDEWIETRMGGAK